MPGTPLRITTLVRLEQESNALYPGSVTLPGIVTLVRLDSKANDWTPSLVTGRPSMVSGMVTAPPGPVYRRMVMAEPSDE